jgi:hypothetical protein
MKELPPSFGQSTNTGSMSGVMAGGMREKGVLMPGSARKNGLDKPSGKSTDMFHQDPNTKLIPPA